MLYTIQPAGEVDAMAIFQFISDLEETIFDYKVFEKIYRSNISNPEYYYFIAASEQDMLIGFISCHTQNLLHHCGRVAEIQELYVDDRYRSMGIGRQLISTVEKELLENGCGIIEVTAQHKRVSTHHFYESNGFECTHKKFVKQLS